MSSLTPSITLPGRPQGPRSPARAPSEHFRVIAFGIGSYTFALPMGAIAKVIHCPPLQTPGLGRTGLIHLEQKVIRILDLHRLINSTGDSGDSGDSSDALGDQDALFLVIARQSNGELCGIPVDTPPDLLELSRSQIQPLPPSAQQDAILSLSQLIAVLPRESTEDEDANPVTDTTLLLLDLDRVSFHSA